jgi:hypothetical protein
MIVNSHPMMLTRIAAQRYVDLQNQVDRERLASLAQRHADHRQPWAGLSAPRILAGLLALLLTVARHG